MLLRVWDLSGTLLLRVFCRWRFSPPPFTHVKYFKQFYFTKHTWHFWPMGFLTPARGLSPDSLPDAGCFCRRIGARPVHGSVHRCMPRNVSMVPYSYLRKNLVVSQTRTALIVSHNLKSLEQQAMRFLLKPISELQENSQCENRCG